MFFLYFLNSFSLNLLNEGPGRIFLKYFQSCTINCILTLFLVLLLIILACFLFVQIHNYNYNQINNIIICTFVCHIVTHNHLYQIDTSWILFEKQTHKWNIWTIYRVDCSSIHVLPTSFVYVKGNKEAPLSFRDFGYYSLILFSMIWSAVVGVFMI